MLQEYKMFLKKLFFDIEMKIITSIFLIGFVCFLFLASNVEAASPYTVGMMNTSTAMYSGYANVMIIGDSLNSNAASPRVMMGYMQKWRPLAWRGITTQGINSVQDQGTAVFNEPSAAQANISTIRPGQLYYDGTNGHVPFITKFYKFNSTGDFPNFGTMITMQLWYENYSAWSNDWSNNTNLTARVMYLSDPNFTEVAFNGQLRNGSQVGSTHRQGNEAVRGIYWEDVSVPASTGTSSIMGWFQSWNQNESVANFSTFAPVATRIYNPSLTTGLELSYVGYGGFTTRTHYSGEALTNIDGFNFTGNYTDASITQFINATQANIYLIWLGQNSAFDEWDGVSIRNYSSNIIGVMDRYTRVHHQANITAGKTQFILVSTYDTSEDNTKFVQIENALENITRNQLNTNMVTANIAANATIALIKLRQFVNDSNGSYANWGSVYTGDTVHPNVKGSVYFGQSTWFLGMNAITPVNGSTDGLNFTLASATIINTTTGTNQFFLNNTDIYSQGVNLSNVQNVLVYYPQYTYSGLSGQATAALSAAFTPNVTNAMGTFNFTLGPYGRAYVINYYNVTQGLARSNDPLTLIVYNSTSISISSTVTTSIEANIILVANASWGTACSNVQGINYTRESGPVTVWSGQAARNVCNNMTTSGYPLIFDQAASSNDLVFFIQAPSSDDAQETCDATITAFLMWPALIGLIGTVALLGFIILLISGYASSKGEGSFGTTEVVVIILSIVSIAVLVIIGIVAVDSICSTGII